MSTWCCYLLARQSRQQGSLETATQKKKRKPALISSNYSIFQSQHLMPSLCTQETRIQLGSTHLCNPFYNCPHPKGKKKKCFILRVITRGSLSGALSLHPTRQPIITTHQTGCERGIIRLNSLRKHIQHTQ